MLQLHYTLRDARRLLVVLICFETVLAGIFVADYLLGKPSFFIHALFDMDGEACIPAWFSSMQLFLVGMVLLLGSRAPAAPRQPSGRFLAFMGACFIFLSADEAGTIHERLRGLMKHAAAALPQVNGHGVWVSLYVLCGLVLLLLCYRHLIILLRLFPREAGIACSGFAIMCLGAVGLEIISYAFLRDGSTPLYYALEVALEEFCEMSGASIVLYGVTSLAIKRLEVHAMAGTIPQADTIMVRPLAVADEASAVPLAQVVNSIGGDA